MSLPQSAGREPAKETNWMKWKLQEFGADEKCNHCKSKAKNSLLAR
jgi:hypothetical protein